MAQSKNSRTRANKLGVVYEYPSRFGSHASMAVDLEASPPHPDLEGYNLSENQILLEDEYGTYVTLKSRLDTGLMDPARVDAVKRPRILK